MFSTEPRIKAANNADVLDLGYGARHQVRGKSTRGIRTPYNRAFRRNQRAVCAEELADYLENGPY